MEGTRHPGGLEDGEEERSWEEEGVLARGCNTQISGSGGSAFTGDDKIQSVTVAIGGGLSMDRGPLGRRLGMGKGPAASQEVSHKGKGQRDPF